TRLPRQWTLQAGGEASAGATTGEALSVRFAAGNYVCWSKPAARSPALMPVGIEKGRPAHLFQPAIFLFRQRKRSSGNIVPELFLVAAADHEGGDSRSPEQPCQRHLCGRDAALPADFEQCIDDRPEPVFVADGRFVPAGDLA